MMWACLQEARLKLVPIVIKDESELASCRIAQRMFKVENYFQVFGALLVLERIEGGHCLLLFFHA